MSERKYTSKRESAHQSMSCHMTGKGVIKSQTNEKRKGEGESKGR